MDGALLHSTLCIESSIALCTSSSRPRYQGHRCRGTISVNHRRWRRDAGGLHSLAAALSSNGSAAQATHSPSPAIPPSPSHDHELLSLFSLLEAALASPGAAVHAALTPLGRGLVTSRDVEEGAALLAVDWANLMCVEDEPVQWQQKQGAGKGMTCGVAGCMHVGVR
jgi:hypothetical protein